MPLKGLAERQKSAALPAADVENRDWLSTAATNTGALTAKQRYDLKRVRAYYDLHDQAIDDAIAAIAAEMGTSKSQVASFFLALGLHEYLNSNSERTWNTLVDGKTPARTLRYEWDVELPDAWIEEIRAFLKDGPD
jgi:hypothetical protein